MNRTVIAPIIAAALVGSVLLLTNRGLSMRDAGAGIQPTEKSPGVKNKPVPVLVELFTSEGCSSCPPADALLAKLAKNSGLGSVDVIPLEEHVDYWNHLGWADPFSSSRYTSRQQSYVHLMHLDQVYTPQMVVDGRRELLGSDAGAASTAIAESSQVTKAAAAITVTAIRGTEASKEATREASNEVSLEVRIDPIPAPRDNETTDMIVAITEDSLQSNVQRGENAGHKLSHVGVVRTWQLVGHGNRKESTTAKVNVTLESGWKRPNLHAVMFVQGHDSGQVYCAATAKIEPARQ